MSDTPETDAQDQRPIRVVIKLPDGATTHYIPADFARKLERERNSLQDQRDFCMGEIERLRKEATQKDKLLAEMRAAIRWVADDSCKGWLL